MHEVLTFIYIFVMIFHFCTLAVPVSIQLHCMENTSMYILQNISFGDLSEEGKSIRGLYGDLKIGL